MKKGETKQRSIRLDIAIISGIEKLAKENNRTFNNQVETILLNELKNKQ